MEKRPWFESWFDSPYYHMLYRHRDEEEAQFFIDNLIAYLKPERDASMLDLACGKGRHAKYLADKGYKVTGADLSEKSIKAAKKNERENLYFVVHDMREPIPGAAFDHIFNFFTSFGYFKSQEDNLRVLQSVERMLKTGGWFVLDFFNVHSVKDKLVPEETQAGEGIEFHIQRRTEGGFILKEIDFEDEGRQFHFRESVQALEEADFEQLFAKTGIEIKKVWGDYGLNGFDPETSERLIILAQKL